MSYLAIDLGTTFIKGAVLDLDTQQHAHVRRQPFPAALPNRPTYFYEVDPAAIVEATRALVTELLPLAPDCRGVVLCTQMHGLVLATPSGAARSTAMTWLDQRVLTPHPAGNGRYFDHLKALVSAAEMREVGRELQISRPLGYLYWMAQTGNLPAEPVAPLAIADFVIAHLSGTRPPVEPTNAGAYSAFNLATGDWHWSLLERLGLAQLQWPAVQPFGPAVAEITVGGQTLPWYAPVGDHQCAIVGALLAPDELSLNISTGSQVSLLTAGWQPGDYQTRPFFDGHCLNTFTGIPAGRALNHLVSLIAEWGTSQGVTADPWTYITEAAAAVAESDLAVNLAFFDSVGGSSGHIANIREGNLSVGHLFYAAFRDMADNYQRAAQGIAPDRPWQRLVYSGGLAQKIPTLRQLINDRFGVPDRLAPSNEDTMVGLLALALVADGRATTVTEAIATLRQRLVG
jgi:sugar (pentulose or hexulose) kinase